MRKTVLLLASMTLAVLLACGVALTAGTEPAKAAFPGPNGKLVFVEEREEGDDDSLQLINQNGSGLVTLLERPYLSDPAMSPDGTRVAFTDRRNAEIYIINISNGRVRQLTNNALDDGDPTRSPDGTRVAFVRSHDDGFDLDQDILVMRVDGTGTPVNVTKTPDEPDEGSPAWSPNGEEIAYSEGIRDVVVQNLETGQRRKLTDDGSTREDWAPTWSPDGTRIAFVRLAYREPNCGWSSAILTMNASDGSDRRLLAGVCGEGSGNRLLSVGGPAYSPDGKQIAYVETRSDFASNYFRRQLMKMNASTGANKQPIYKVISPEFSHFVRVPDWGVSVQR